MKLLIVILLFVHCQASFFDDFNDAMFSVQNSFENLVEDVKINIECTVFAVQRVLSLGGITDEPSDDYGCDNDRKPEYDLPQVNVQTRGKEYFSKQIDISITNVNRTLSNLFQKHNTGGNTDSMKTELKSETDRLSEISALLMRELENITKNVKSKYTNIDLNINKSSLENIWSDIKVLREIEHTQKDETEAKEIHEVFNKIIHILNVNDTDSTLNDSDKTEQIIKTLETRTNTNISDADVTFAEWEKEGLIHDEKLQDRINKDIPASFKRVSQQILNRSKKDSEESQTNNNDNYFSYMQDRIKEDSSEHRKTIPTSYRQVSSQISIKSNRNSDESQTYYGRDNARQIQDRISEDLPESLKNIGQTFEKKSLSRSYASTEGAETSNSDWNTQAKDDSEERDKQHDNFPKTFKDVFKKQVNYARQDESDESNKSNEASQNYNDESSKYFSSYSNFNPQYTASQEDVIQQAQSIMADNKYTEMIMSNILNNPDTVTESIFDNPEMYGFA